MRISFTCNNIGTGGAERVICNIANQMAKDGHYVKIICYEKLPSFYYPLENNVNIVELDSNINNRKNVLARKFAGLLNLFRLYKALKETDCVVSFYTRQNCYSILVGFVRNIPVICAERDHFFTCDSKLNHLMRKLFYPRASGFIHQTTMARDFLRLNEGVKCMDVVIPNPLWIKSYPQRCPIKGRLVAVGRLAEQKNYDGMIKAFSVVHKKLPYTELWIYGEGYQKNYLQGLCNSLSIQDSVIFAGMSKNVVDELSKAEIFVMFSHGEGYPNALMEALAVGVPSISSDCPVGGPKDMICNGENGFLVKNEAELSSKMIELLNDNVLKESFSRKSILIRDSNSFCKIYNQWIDYIKFVIKKYYG